MMNDDDDDEVELMFIICIFPISYLSLQKNLYHKCSFTPHFTDAATEAWNS